MKKFLGLILAGVMVMSMSVFVFAEGESSSSTQVIWTECKCKQPCSSFLNTGICYCATGAGFACYCAGGGPSSGGSSEDYDAGSEAAALAAKEIGLSMDVLQGASDANKSVGEYLNNAVNSVAGIANATPVAQGGAVIINGQPSNQVFSVNKPLPAHIEAAKAQAVAVGGQVMNCVDVDAGVYFDVATVNFYTPGITGAENVQVYHFTSGQWMPVNVAEVREDHIVVDMTAPGVLVFVKMPAEAVAE